MILDFVICRKVQTHRERRISRNRSIECLRHQRFPGITYNILIYYVVFSDSIIILILQEMLSFVPHKCHHTNKNHICSRNVSHKSKIQCYLALYQRYIPYCVGNSLID